MILKAEVTPSEFETFTERTALGVVEAMPSLPSMYVFKAAKDPREVPPETVSPVVVALLAVIFPKAERLVTLSEPSDVPPVTVSDVEVPAPKTNDPSKVPPLTVRPVVVALARKVAAETVRLVVEALTIVVLEPTGLTEKRLLELFFPFQFA